MEWKPSRQQHDLDGNEGHASPGDLSEQGERDLGEHVDVHSAAARQYGGPGMGHVRRIGGVSGELEGVVGLYRAAEIHLTTGVERPAAVVPLLGANVDGDLALECRIHLVHEVHHEDVLGRDGAVCLELVAPVAFRMLLGPQRFRGPGNAGGEPVVEMGVLRGGRRDCHVARAQFPESLHSHFCSTSPSTRAGAHSTR